MEIGTKLGHYEIMDRLGAGGMREVYRARDTKLKREVALKLLPEDLATNPERLARLEREASVTTILDCFATLSIRTHVLGGTLADQGVWNYPNPGDMP